jgi:hypothetical protein
VLPSIVIIGVINIIKCRATSSPLAPALKAVMAIVTTPPPYAVLNAALKRLSPNDYAATLPTGSAL